MSRYFIFFVFLMSHCLANVDEHPYRMEKNTQDNIRDQSRNQLIKFENDLECYFAYLDVEAITEQDNAYGRFLLENKEDLKNAVKKAEHFFSDFRLALRDVIFAKYGNYPATGWEIRALNVNVTDWYTTFMAELLFPEDWENTFQKSLEVKNETVN